jgi:uncharacterized protein (TIGR03435 family)
LSDGNAEALVVNHHSGLPLFWLAQYRFLFHSQLWIALAVTIHYLERLSLKMNYTIRLVLVEAFLQRKLPPRFLLIVKIVIVLSLGVFVSPVNATSYENGPEVGQTAPALKINRWLQAPPEAAAGWPTGKLVVLEFWATWCGPCVGSIPHLNELSDHFKGRPVQFVAVTDEEESVIQQFLKKTSINAWIGLGLDAGCGENKPYKVYSLPHTVIIDPHGRIAAIMNPGALTADLIEHYLTGKPLPSPQSQQITFEMGNTQIPGVVPGQKRISQKPLYQVMIRPQSMTNYANCWSDDCLTLQPSRLDKAIFQVFDVKKTRVIADVELPTEPYDFYIAQQSRSYKAGQSKKRLEAVFAQAVEGAFGLTIKREVREIDVLVLKTNESSSLKLARSTNECGQWRTFWGEVSGTDKHLSDLAQGLEYAVSKPVLDETGLTNNFSYDVKWDQNDSHPNSAGMIMAVKEQLGLDLVPAKRSLEMVVLQKAQ